MPLSPIPMPVINNEPRKRGYYNLISFRQFCFFIAFGTRVFHYSSYFLLVFEVESLMHVVREREVSFHNVVLVLLVPDSLLAHGEALDGDDEDDPGHEEGHDAHGHGEEEHGVEAVVLHCRDAVGCL